MAKKFVLCILALTLMLSFSACNKDDESKNGNDNLLSSSSEESESTSDLGLKESQEEASKQEEEQIYAAYSYALGLKSFEKAEGTVNLKGVSLDCNKEDLKLRAEKLFEKGDTKINLILDESFCIENANPELSAQGYMIKADNDITVTAATEAGLYYGVRTLSDYNKLQGCIEKGIYLDWPDVAERCLHFDVARKHFSKDFIIDMIEHAATYKMNAVQLHFSENEGFRIECETDPAIVSDKYLTKAEVREILAAAKEHYVEIIPSFDSPGHLLQVLKVHPEFSLTDVDGYNSPKTLDITNPDAVAYIKSLLDEYAELFSDCKSFNIGGDESFGWSNIDRMQFGAWKVLENHAKATYGDAANAHDSYVGYLNDIAAYIMDKGFTVRAWNDGLMRTTGQAAVVKPDPKIEICYWSNSYALRAAGVQSFLDAGHNVYNVNEPYMYYVLKDEYEQPKATKIFKEWNAGILPDSNCDYKTPEEVGKQLKGAYFCIWCDRPDTQTAEEILEGSSRAMAAMAVKAWNANPNIDYADFAAQFNAITA